MSRPIRLLALVTVALGCFLGIARAASAALITIDPGAYQGRYYIAPFTGFSTGPTTVDLADGVYALDTGASIGGSSFGFTVSDGKVTSVSNGSAVPSADGTTLTLRNTTVTVDAGSYTGRYYLSAFGNGDELTGTQSFVLVPDLLYALDGGSFIVTTIGGVATPSDFLFSVAADGTVTVVPGSPVVPATATGSEIDLNSVFVTVDVSPATSQYRLCSQPAGVVVTGVTTVSVIPGLADCVGDGLNAGYFVAGPSGIQPGALGVGALSALLTTGTSVTAAALTSATATFVTSSPTYAALAAPLQSVVNGALTMLNRVLGSSTTLSPAQRLVYTAAVNVFARLGLLTSDQAALLKNVAATT